MIAKLKAGYAALNARRGVQTIDVFMLGLFLFENGAKYTVRTIQAVEAGSRTESYFLGLMAIISFGWVIELATSAKKVPDEAV